MGAVAIIEELNLVAETDSAGNYRFEDVPAGTYSLKIKYIGHDDYVQKITLLEGETHTINIEIEEDKSIQKLQEVVVMGKTETQEVKEQAIKAEVVDTKKVQHESVTLSELMNRTPGIRMRQVGGLGSATNMMINGFQGRAIKFFKDGIPMSYLGAGFDISSVPVNMLERVEVYKGVLPIHLGADALGGAVNLVSKNSLPKYVDASYEHASFNTHRVTLTGLYHDTARKVFVGASTFFNHSDNNYKVVADVEDYETANLVPKEVRLFHNKFTNYYAELFGGVKNTKWADELRFGLTGFHITRQNQFGARMTQPFGAAQSIQHSIVPTLRYQKSFLKKKIHFDQFFAYNTIHVQQVDTAGGLYDWYGEFRPSANRVGEMTTLGSLAKIQYTYLTSRTNLSYQISKAHKIEFNATYIGMHMVGSDRFGKKFSDSQRDILSVPAEYNKTILSLGLQSKIYKEIITNVLAVKRYHYTTDYVYAGNYPPVEAPSTTQNETWGVAEALKVAVSPHSFFRASVELATRMPEQDEIFGDGNLQLSNLRLKPERSTNMNLGFRSEKSQKYAIELNTFYRVTQDLIINVAPVNFMFSQYQNVEDVKGLGMEADANLSILKWLKVNGNFTYQEFRLQNTGFKSTEGARLKNTPYFFANAGLNTVHKTLFSKNDKLQFYWYYSFVREYYLDYIPVKKEPDGFLGLWGKARFDAPNIIPNQHIQSVGLTYSPISDLSIGFQVKNVLDAMVYNNFRVQNAGRSFHVKINYLFK